jgi:hypothetical protein
MCADVVPVDLYTVGAPSLVQHQAIPPLEVVATEVRLLAAPVRRQMKCIDGTYFEIKRILRSQRKRNMSEAYSASEMVLHTSAPIGSEEVKLERVKLRICQPARRIIA